MNRHIGHQTQLYGVEEHRLVGGKGDGMRLLQVKNGRGLEFTVSLDRCADISRLSYKADNFGYFAPCGYVAPQYYDNAGVGFLKSFTAGFLTTCGLTAVGSPCTDESEVLPLHGTIANAPSEHDSYWVESDSIHIKAVIRDASLFNNQLLLTREYVCSLKEDKINITDTVQNIGSRSSPFMMLYHFNMGYPLLSENSKVYIPSKEITPRNGHAAKSTDFCLQMEEPQAGFEEQCYYHCLSDHPAVAIFNEEINKGVAIKYDSSELPYFTQWKMMGEYEYVLGLEPGNCTPDGRDVMRKNGKLKFLNPNEAFSHHIEVNILNNKEKFEEIKKC